MASAPSDAEIIILFDCGTVDIVRLCWWNHGVGLERKPDPNARGWWSYHNSVAVEKINTDLMQPVGWIPYPEQTK